MYRYVDLFVLYVEFLLSSIRFFHFSSVYIILFNILVLQLFIAIKYGSYIYIYIYTYVYIHTYIYICVSNYQIIMYHFASTTYFTKQLYVTVYTPMDYGLWSGGGCRRRIRGTDDSCMCIYIYIYINIYIYIHIYLYTYKCM
jgi:hypothetical protein